MKRPRRQIYTMDMYLGKMKDEDIRSDQDVQRLSGAWEKSMINELIMTILTDDYIPPIILGEEENSQLWIIDGLQRSTALKLFRDGNFKITATVEDPIINYRIKTRDENGNIVWEDATFNVKNKTYSDLPSELKKRFNEYQIETVIHENCDMKRISKLVRRYNNHISMKPAQKAFTFLDNFARDVRNILDNRFFLDCGTYTETEKINGTLERTIMESVMCMFHMDEWKSQPKQIGKYLNENATKEEFQILENNLCRLENVITGNLKDIFTSKNSYIWFTLFNKFTYSGLEDYKFAEFLDAFQNGLNSKEVDGMAFQQIESGRGTKDKSVVNDKLYILETLMNEYLHIDKIKQQSLQNENVTKAVIDIMENYTGMKEIEDDDVDLFEMIANDISEVIDNLDSEILSDENRIPFVALVGYAIEQDKDDMLETWLSDYERRHDLYNLDRKDRFLHMKHDFDNFENSKEEKSA